ncbi:hypothetical protein [Croceicoccus sp. YJ47]|uniref:hypothetical protein n=1 Tax=Croceicoccus sp. YJ47 TaxID=2798724 RepID=UPI001923ADC4|nr:hypothetical protein [Croceicoccus sp. YJ47]QQN73916.1 hypothetical protein JD971_14395 [Croceicoccus sp. YJ47]
MTGIGHNRAPHEAMLDHVEDLFKLISDSTEGATVTNDEQDAALDALLDDVRTAKKDAEAKRKAEKEPHLKAERAVDAAWKPVTSRLDAAAAEIKALLTPYRTAKQREKDEAARKAREEAEAKEQAARDALQASESLEQRFEAEQQLKRASKLKATANKIDRAPTGLRTRQIAVIEDRKTLLQHVMKNDPDALTEWLAEYAQRSLPAKLPGVRIDTERRAA